MFEDEASTAVTEQKGTSDVDHQLGPSDVKPSDPTETETPDPRDVAEPSATEVNPHDLTEVVQLDLSNVTQPDSPQASTKQDLPEVMLHDHTDLTEEPEDEEQSADSVNTAGAGSFLDAGFRSQNTRNLLSTLSM